MLDSFIKGQDQLVQKVFTYCYRSYNSVFSYKELTEELSISYSMLRQVLDQIETIQQSYPEFSIERENKEATIKFSERFLLNKIRVDLTKSTLPFIIWDAIFNQKFKSLESFSQSQYLSRRTVQRQIGEFSPILAQYQIGLNLKKNGYLIGDEFRIRFFFHSFYWHIYDEIDSNRLPIVQKSATVIYQSLTEYFPFLRHADKERFINFLAVTVMRIKQGYLIQTIPETVRKFFNPFISKELFEKEILVPFFEANLLFEKDLPSDEFLYIYYMFTVGQSYSQETLQQIQLQSPTFLSDYRRLIDEWIIQIEEHLQYRFGQDEKRFLFINTTYIFSFLLTFGLGKQIDSFGDYMTISEVEDQYLYLFDLLERIAHSVDTPNEKWTKTINSNSFKYYVSQLLYHILMDRDLPIRVAIESKGRGLEEQLQKQTLVRISPRPIIIVGIRQKPDVVISDYAIDLSKYFSRDLPHLFQWDEKQYLSDWVRVITFINKIRDQKYNQLLS